MAAVVLVIAGCSSEPEEFVDPRNEAAAEANAASNRENVVGLVQSVKEMVRAGEMSSLGEYCEEMVPTFEGYAADDESVYAGAYDSLLTQWQELTAAAKASDKSKMDAASKSLMETLEQLPSS